MRDVESSAEAPNTELSWQETARLAASGLAGADADEETASPRELLVFGLDGSAYAIGVERVREIIRMRDLTRVPRSPDWLLGVVALRGEVVEVVDLRRRLGLSASDPGRQSRIIVLDGHDDRVAGLLVDSVAEVHRASETSIGPAQGADAACVIEMCRRGESFVSILDVDSLLEMPDG